MPKVVVVVPCFNEAGRLQPTEIIRLARVPDLHTVLVDDGSEDDTRAVLAAVAARAPHRVRVYALERNRGKAEAVRLGLLLGIGAGAQVVGYMDADLSTPVAELERLLRKLRNPRRAVVTGARVARAGATIARRPLRHFTGRVFATMASLVLREVFYDTQCGAKLFRVTPALEEALAEPFLSRWAFDVELLGRLLVAREPLPIEAFLEVPLTRWVDVDGSKLRPLAMIKAWFDLFRIRTDLTRRRAVAGRAAPAARTVALRRQWAR